MGGGSSRPTSSPPTRAPASCTWRRRSARPPARSAGTKGGPRPTRRAPTAGPARGTCVGSLAELSDLTGRDLSGLDPHRPVIDEVVFPCPRCGENGSTEAETARRIEPVIDAWFDSGSMPAARVGYPHSPGSAERFEYPADFISEAIDQTRGWFYSLLAVN